MTLRVENVSVSFKKPGWTGLWEGHRQFVLKSLSFELRRGERLGLIGESGSGKSTLARVLCGLLKPDAGHVFLNGTELYRGGRRRRCDISVVFQDYATSVNPRFRIDEVIMEALSAANPSGMSASKAGKRVATLLDQVGLRSSFSMRYPHELSGGELQRVCIARALATEPQALLLDESVSSLDASTQIQILDLLNRLSSEKELSCFFITHDLTAVTYVCDRVMFLHEGEIVETVDPIDRLSQVRSPYARRLLQSVILMD